MATEHHTGLFRRIPLRKLIYLMPAFMIIAAMVNTLACRTSSSSGSATATATPTSTAATLAYVTNYNDGKVSSFTRNTTTGALKHTGQFSAGSNKGPRGVVAAPSGAFLYVANISDDDIYEYSINSTNGTLTPLSPKSVSNGGGTEPDELAMNSAGTLLWATGHAGTVTYYTVNTSTGQLTKGGSIGGFDTPFGITVYPNTALAVLYVSDTTTGLVWPMTYNTTTGALTKNFTAEHSSDPSANTPAAIAIDPSGESLFIADQVLGEVSSFSIDTSTGAIIPEFTFANSSTSDVPVGIGIGVNTGVEYLFTANQGGDSVSSFIASATTLTTPPVLASPYNGPTGLVVDPENLFVYTADKGDGTVAQSIINGTCGTQLCAGPTVATESPANPNSGPFWVTLAP